MNLLKAKAVFLESLENRNTRSANNSDLNGFLAFLGPNPQFQRFNSETIEAYFKGVSGQFSRATLARKKHTLSGFARWCLAREYLAKDPMRLLAVLHVPKTLPRPFMDDEIKRLCSLSLNAREGLVRSLLLYTGLRATPLSRIKVGDVSWTPPELRLFVKRSKTQVIPLHPALAPLLRDYIKTETDGFPETFLFGTIARATPARDVIEKMTFKWGEVAGVKDCTPHRFRHTFATKLLKQTRDIRLVQEALGHDSISTTQIYTQVANEQLAMEVSGLTY